MSCDVYKSCVVLSLSLSFVSTVSTTHLATHVPTYFYTTSNCTYQRLRTQLGTVLQNTKLCTYDILLTYVFLMHNFTCCVPLPIIKNAWFMHLITPGRSMSLPSDYCRTYACHRMPSPQMHTYSSHVFGRCNRLAESQTLGGVIQCSAHNRDAPSI